MEIYLTIYTIGFFVFGLAIALLSINGDVPDEVECFFDGVFYALLWPFVLIKHFVSFAYKLIRP